MTQLSDLWDDLSMAETTTELTMEDRVYNLVLSDIEKMLSAEFHSGGSFSPGRINAYQDAMAAVRALKVSA